ncbi:Sphingolipid fatty acid hydroxylase [Phaffia rhodozyma]|uniref:Ceramide very long chain fatty acid hydroxylase n=1 Tax=Phaffia rhodozyma TaxID=264483 RepID=A0A0F7SH50_PHARH|nr:Sphingolipid fatty acid hydroxylase [Phaffia rhodozyma]
MPALLVHHNGKRYDVSSFLAYHPGGAECIKALEGQDVTEAMRASGGHEHSEAAWEMMEDLQTTVDPDWVAPDGFVPEDTDVAHDFKQSKFLDLNKALLPQLWNAKMSKAFYLSQVHQPRHLPRSALLFGPAYLEVFTKTYWFIVPLIWLPIAMFLAYVSAVQFSNPHLHLTARSIFDNAYDDLRDTGRVAAPHVSDRALNKSTICLGLGGVIWTLLEYVFHRFLFHLDELLPSNSKAFTIHFLMHGVHHYLPMDPYRLVMPPVMFFTLQLPMTTLAHTIIAWGDGAGAWGIIAGAFFGYVCYDCFHYASHHIQMTGYFDRQRKYHLEHHYKNYELGFGVTSKFWDWVFNTTYEAVRPNKASTAKVNAKC